MAIKTSGQAAIVRLHDIGVTLCDDRYDEAAQFAEWLGDEEQTFTVEGVDLLALAQTLGFDGARSYRVEGGPRAGELRKIHVVDPEPPDLHSYGVPLRVRADVRAVRYREIHCTVGTGEQSGLLAVRTRGKEVYENWERLYLYSGRFTIEWWAEENDNEDTGGK